jgi:CHASE2 domain-containing sensor protein
MTDMKSPRTGTDPFPAWAVFFALLAAAAAFAVILSGYGAFVVQRAEQVYSDFRTSLLSDRIISDHPDIVMVSVGENATPSRTTFGGRIEIDRAQLARLIDAIDDSSPRAIGFDVALSGQSEAAKDQALQRALRDAKSRVVLGVRPDRGELSVDRRAWVNRFLTETGRAKGHITAIQEGARVVRVDGGELAIGPIPDSFATLMARARLPDTPRLFGPIAWLQKVDDASVFSRFLNIGGQQPFRVLYADDLLDATKPLPTRQLANKLVIVTSGLGELDGRITTPLTAWTRETVAPIQVQAQAIAQLVDGRTAGDLPARTSRLLLFALACLGALAGWYRSRGWNIGAAVLTLLVLFVLDSVFFAWFNINLPLVEGLVTWILGEIVGRQMRRILQWEERYGQPWPIDQSPSDAFGRPRTLADFARTVRDLGSSLGRRDN